MTINQEIILSHLVSTGPQTVPTHTAFEKPTYEVPKHKYTSQMNVWVIKLKATMTAKPERRKNKKPALITKTDTIYYLQERQCTCNVTLRRVHVNIVAVEKQ